MRRYKTNQQRRLAAFFETHGITYNGKFPVMPMKRTKHGEFAVIKVHTDALTPAQLEAFKVEFPYWQIFNSQEYGFAIIDC
jgi:hypothetical protein